MTTVTVRAAVTADDTALLAVERVGWTAGSGFPSYDHLTRESFFTERRRPSGLLVAVLDGRIVGYVMVRPKSAIKEAVHVLAMSGLLPGRPQAQPARAGQ